MEKGLEEGERSGGTGKKEEGKKGERKRQADFEEERNQNKKYSEQKLD